MILVAITFFFTSKVGCCYFFPRLISCKPCACRGIHNWYWFSHRTLSEHPSALTTVRSCCPAFNFSLIRSVFTAFALLVCPFLSRFTLFSNLSSHSIPAFLGSAHVILVFSSYFLRISCYFLSYFSSYSGCLVSTMRRRKPTSSIILQENNETFLRQRLHHILSLALRLDVYPLLFYSFELNKTDTFTFICSNILTRTRTLTFIVCHLLSLPPFVT